MDLKYRGITLKTTGIRCSSVLARFPSVHPQPDITAVEPVRSAGLGRTSWRPRGCARTTSGRVRQPHCGAWRDPHGARLAGFRLRSPRRVGDPNVRHGAMGDLLVFWKPGAFVPGLDLQDSLLRWLLASTSRRFLGVRHPASDRVITYRFHCWPWTVARSERPMRERIRSNHGHRWSLIAYY